MENLDQDYEPNPEREVKVTVSLTLSKTVTINTTNYIVTNKERDDNGLYYEDVEYTNLKRDVEEQVTLPCYLAEFVDCMFEADLDLKAAGKCKYLRDALADCRNWSIDDFEVVE